MARSPKRPNPDGPIKSVLAHQLVCLACGLDGGKDLGPLRKKEVYYHRGKCEEVVADGIDGLQAYLGDARDGWGSEPGPAGDKGPLDEAETGIGVAAGYVAPGNTGEGK